jgi:hypothetical protein
LRASALVGECEGRRALTAARDRVGATGMGQRPSVRPLEGWLGGDARGLGPCQARGVVWQVPGHSQKGFGPRLGPRAGEGTLWHTAIRFPDRGGTRRVTHRR